MIGMLTVAEMSPNMSLMEELEGRRMSEDVEMVQKKKASKL